jgi:hypothetical protein
LLVNVKIEQALPAIQGHQQPRSRAAFLRILVGNMPTRVSGEGGRVGTKKTDPPGK